MSNAVTEMDPQVVAGLYSAEAHFYTSCCFRYDDQCVCEDRVHLDGGLARQVMIAKRKDDSYYATLASIEAEGQHEPVRLCYGGCCLIEGHHRLAALIDLDRGVITTYRSGRCHSPQMRSFARPNR